MQPLKKTITSLEKKLDKLTSESQEIETALADNSLYQAENKAKLNTLLAQQAKCVPLLNEVEEQLLEHLDELETKEIEFAETLGE